MALKVATLKALQERAPAMWQPAAAERLRELIASGQQLVDAYDPHTPQILNVMGMSAFRLGELAEAERYLRLGVAFEPADCSAPDLWLRNNLAFALIEAGRPAEAMAEVRAVG